VQKNTHKNMHAYVSTRDVEKHAKIQTKGVTYIHRGVRLICIRFDF